MIKCCKAARARTPNNQAQCASCSVQLSACVKYRRTSFCTAGVLPWLANRLRGRSNIAESAGFSVYCNALAHFARARHIMGADDVKAMFKAAKAQRGGGGTLVRVLPAITALLICCCSVLLRVAHLSLLRSCAPRQSKEQLKQLRAQKAASAQQAAQMAEAQRSKAAAVSAAAQARQKSAAGMPPPAPRAPSGSLPASTSSKAATSSATKPQAAIIRPKAQTNGQSSVNGRTQEPAHPSSKPSQQQLCKESILARTNSNSSDCWRSSGQLCSLQI